MPTRNFLINRDSSVITNLSLGNTVDQHHPVGRHQSSGSIYRVYMRFTMDFSGMTAITGCNLWMRSTPTTHISKGSLPQINVKKLTVLLSDTQGGSSEGTWSGTAVPRTALGVTTVDESGPAFMTTGANIWGAVDITAMMQSWFAGGTHFGLQVGSDDESSNVASWEFFSMDSANDPYLEVIYSESSATFVRRSGVWVKGQPSVSVRRSGAWADPLSEVYVRRSGVWVNAT